MKRIPVEPHVIKSVGISGKDDSLLREIFIIDPLAGRNSERLVVPVHGQIDMVSIGRLKLDERIWQPIPEPLVHSGKAFGAISLNFLDPSAEVPTRQRAEQYLLFSRAYT